jgi:beta-lactamase class A
MMFDLSRFAPLFFAFALFLDTHGFAAAESKAHLSVTKQIAEIETRVGGRLGVVALDTSTGKHIEYRATERFPLCSTFKLLLAAALLSRVDQNEEKLDKRISYTESDLLEYAPVTRQRAHEGSMTVSELCAAAIEYSDNTAANLLLKTIGGPAKLTEYIRSIGDTVTRLDRDEPSLNTAIKGDDRDTTSPISMTNDMKALLVGSRLSEVSRQQLQNWLIANTTGAKRLRAGFPTTWRIGDKTGSGQNGASNDIAIVWSTNRPPILIAVYLTESKASADECNGAIAAVGRIVEASF